MKTKPQYSLYRAKAKQTPIQRCLSKKKKPNIEPLYQNQTKKTPILARRHRSSLLVIVVARSLAPCRHRRSPLIADHSAPVLGAWCSPP